MAAEFAAAMKAPVLLIKIGPIATQAVLAQQIQFLIEGQCDVFHWFSGFVPSVKALDIMAGFFMCVLPVVPPGCSELHLDPGRLKPKPFERSRARTSGRYHSAGPPIRTLDSVRAQRGLPKQWSTAHCAAGWRKSPGPAIP